MSEARFVRYQNATRFKRCVCCRDGSPLVVGVMQGIEEYGAVVIGSTFHGFVVIANEVQLLGSKAVTGAVFDRKFDHVRGNVLSGHLVPVKRIEHAGPRAAAPQIKQLSGRGGE